MALDNIDKDIEICNAALIKINQPKINAFEDDKTPQSYAISTIYNQARQSLLSSYVWNITIKNHILGKSTNGSPIEIPKDADEEQKKILRNEEKIRLLENGGFKYSYDIPSDFLRLICVFDSGFNILTGGEIPPFLFEGKTIKSDINGLNIKYVFDEKSIANFPSYLKDCLILTLATRLTKMFNDSTAYLQNLQMELDSLLKTARIIDCSQTMFFNHSPTTIGYMGEF